MTMKITVTVQQFKAATIVKAAKDVRFYLKGYFFDSKRNKLVTTDGHIMYVTSLESPIKQDALIGLLGAAPTKYDCVEFDTETLKATFNCLGQAVAMVPIEIIDGRFPDWERVTMSNAESQSVQEIGFMPGLVNQAMKVVLCHTGKAKNPIACKWVFRGTTSVVAIEILEGTSVYIMPARV